MIPRSHACTDFRFDFVYIWKSWKIFKKLDDEKPVFIIEDTSDQKLVEAVAQVDKFIDKIFAKK